jgi:hypothetical protein
MKDSVPPTMVVAGEPPAPTMHSPHRVTGMRRPARSQFVIALVALCAGCVPANPVSPDGATPDHLPAGAYFLRSIDGRSLPLTIAGGTRIESGFIVADSAESATVGFGESLGHASSSSASLATGTARVLGQDSRDGRIAAISWRSNGSARADSVLWSVDSVIVYRTGAAPSAVGPGHRMIYTRATPADTL